MERKYHCTKCKKEWTDYDKTSKCPDCGKQGNQVCTKCGEKENVSYENGIWYCHRCDKEW